MKSSRLESFTDGVLAIIITLMVLELDTPKDASLEALADQWNSLLSFLLSFIYIGIYWNNHHHLMHAVEKISGKVLWANLHLLLWISMIPFATRWMGQSFFQTIPVAIYGSVLFMASVAWLLLITTLKRYHQAESHFTKAQKSDKKEWISIILYCIGIAFTFIKPYVGIIIYLSVAAFWFIPDRRIENQLK